MALGWGTLILLLHVARRLGDEVLGPKNDAEACGIFA